MLTNTDTQIQKENNPWEDWEDCGGFDDEESLIGMSIMQGPDVFQAMPWYYEKKRGSNHQSNTLGIQTSFL